jgi:uncharacterized protein YggE
MASKKSASKVITAPNPKAIDLNGNQKIALGVVIILVALFALSAAIFSKVDNKYPNTISFSATGSAEVVPDAIKVSATASILANRSSSALEQLSQVADQMRAVLSQNSIDAKNISSANLSLYPEYSFLPNGGRSLLGYRALQNFEINILDSKKAALVIDQMSARTGNNLQINSISSYISDPAAATEKARADAMAQAKAKGEAYAKLADEDLGDIVSINEDNNQYQPMPMQMAKDSGGSTSFDMGLSKVSVSIFITYELD